MIALLLNHLWQSSLCLGLAGLIALALRRNSANIRFWVWFAASLKFLVPFAALTALGTFALAPIVPPIAVPNVRVAEPIAQPFSEPMVVQITAGLIKPSAQSARSAVRPEPAQSAPGLAAFHPNLESILLAIWAAGFLGLAVRWVRRWQRVRVLVRDAEESQLVAPVEVKYSPSQLEPGLVGIRAPVILLPRGIEQELSPEELKAVLAHELCHWRRHDNLLAATHMLVEALFWFFPLIWWLGARLNAERERACDESVLAEGNDPQVYTEGILKVCSAYLQSPLACVAGVSGAGLKTRIAAILENRLVLRVGTVGRFVLSTTAIIALALPVALGLLTSPAAQMQAKAAPMPVEGKRAQSSALAQSDLPQPSNDPSANLTGGRAAMRTSTQPDQAASATVQGPSRLLSRQQSRRLAVTAPELSRLLSPVSPDLFVSNDAYPVPAQAASDNSTSTQTAQTTGGLAPISNTAGAGVANCAPPKLVTSLHMESVPDSDTMTISASIDGKRERLLIDLGAVSTKLWEKNAAELNLPRAQALFARVSSLALGRMESGTRVYLQVMANPSDVRPAFDGVLGTDMMNKFDIDLDFAHQKLNYFSPEQCKGAGVYWNPSTITSVPMVENPSRYGQLAFVPVILDGKTIIALLDTGADKTFVNPSLASKLFGLNTESMKMSSLIIGDTLVKAGIHRFSRVTFGGLIANNPEIAVPLDTVRPVSHAPLRDRPALPWEDYGTRFGLNWQQEGVRAAYTSKILPDMVIGMDVLKHSHLYISFENKRVYVSAAGDGPAINKVPTETTSFNQHPSPGWARGQDGN